MVDIMLSKLGYTVHCCESGGEALNRFLQDKNQYDLIITDQTMPEITGAELAHEIRKVSDTVPIILCTGYSARISDENWMRHGVNSFIMKPFRKSELAVLIRELLESPQKNQTGNNTDHSN
jgi:CheY-like chemotaxis protein